MLISIIKKELKRVFTDKRLIISTFIIPAISIYVIYSLMGNMANGMVDDIQEHESIIHIENAPESFKAYMDGAGDSFNATIAYGDYDEEAITEELKEKEIDLFVQFEDGFDEAVSAYETEVALPNINMSYNPAEEYSSAARGQFNYSILGGYKSYLLQDRFGNINFTEAFVTQETTVVEEDVVAAGMMSMMLPMLIGIMLFAGAMSIGLDTIAGEKERGTMATMLLTPVKREKIALGKVIGLVIISIISSICYFISILFSLPKLAAIGGDVEGASFSLEAMGLTPMNLVQLIVIMITLVGVYVGIVATISVRARSMKEAQTYMAPVYMVIMVAAFSTMFARGGAEMYKFFVPVYGSITAIQQLLEGNLMMNHFLVVIGMSLATTGLLVAVITRSFNNEDVMFNS